jgi:hypothetical protein
MEYNFKNIEDIEVALIEEGFTAEEKIEVLTEIFNETGRKDVAALIEEIEEDAAATIF